MSLFKLQTVKIKKKNNKCIIDAVLNDQEMANGIIETQLQCRQCFVAIPAKILAKKKCVWCKSNTSENTLLTVKYGGVSIMLQVGFSLSGTGYLVKTEGKTNGEISRNILLENLENGRKVHYLHWKNGDCQSEPCSQTSSRICGMI